MLGQALICEQKCDIKINETKLIQSRLLNITDQEDGMLLILQFVFWRR